MNLSLKTREEIAVALDGKTRGELVDLICSLATFERLLSARQIALASRVSPHVVAADMRAGRFVDAIFGAGFFCFGSNSLKVSASAANAWRGSFFVRCDSIPGHKKESGSETDVDVENARAKGRRIVRDLAPGFLLK